MAIDIFMQISDPTINGGSQSQVAPNQFEIASLSFGGVAPVNGKPTLTEITATLGFASSTDLFLSMVDATTHEVKFSIYKAGGDAESPPLEQAIQLTKALITMVQESATGSDDGPALEITWSFQSIKVTEADSKTIFMYNNGPGG